jgi:hypothetical protein
MEKNMAKIILLVLALLTGEQIEEPDVEKKYPNQPTVIRIK